MEPKPYRSKCHDYDGEWVPEVDSRQWRANLRIAIRGNRKHHSVRNPECFRKWQKQMINAERMHGSEAFALIPESMQCNNCLKNERTKDVQATEVPK